MESSTRAIGVPTFPRGRPGGRNSGSDRRREVVRGLAVDDEEDTSSRKIRQISGNIAESVEGSVLIKCFPLYKECMS